MTASRISGDFTEVWDKQADVIIVGAGDAGLAAAIESADAGANTVVFEKLGTIRSTSSAMAGGAISFAGTDFQQRNGIEDSNELFFKDIMDTGDWKNYQPLVNLLIKEQLDTYYWLTSLGVRWQRLITAVGMSIPRGHNTDPVEHVSVLKEAAEKRGAEILLRTKVAELLTDNDKRVMGVCIGNNGQTLRVKARKGVVLATGGFGFDTKRLEMIDPRLAKIKVIVSPGHTGDGHRMAEMLGASFRHMELEYHKPNIGWPVSGGLRGFGLTAFRSGAILVNKTGKRFVDESLQDKAIGGASLDQPDMIVYEIFDQKIFDIEQQKRGEFSKGIAKLLIKARTIPELAYKIEVPQEALKETVDRYNGCIDLGINHDFGRNGFTKKIDTTPFYAYETIPWLAFTCGGVAVDENMHMLTSKGIIPGLYGAGELVGGFHGAGYHVGTALTKALVTGRIAGRNCAMGR